MAAPYGNLQVERQTDGGAWARIATVGVVTSYVDKGTVANRKYRYRVRAVNGSLASAYSTDAEFMTTPAAPSNVSAKKNAAGGIEVRWTDLSSFNTHFEIWHAADGVWDSTALATIANGVQPYVHASPSTAVTHTYRVKSKTTTPVLLSAYSAPSNVVALTAPPNAPTPIAPVSVAADANDTIAFQWQHNPTDTTDQRQYEFQWRVGGGAWSSSGVIASSTQGGVIAGGTLANGQTLEWQVRTWGDHADPSPWSTVAVVPLSTKPTVLVNSPEVGVPYASSTVTATWGYSDEEANPQARWQATLYNAAGDAVETLTGSGDASSATFATAVTDGGEYAVGVKAQDSTGVWSAEDTVVFVVAFAKPPVPRVRLEWIADSAAVAVAVENPPTSEGEADVVSVSVWRSVNGADWVLIGDQLDPNSSTTDFIPGLGVVNYYKAVAKSALPSVSESLVEEIVTDQARAVWVNAGPGFSQAVRLASNVKLDRGAGRARTLRQTAGLEYPLENSGQQKSRKVSLTARLWTPTHPRAALSSTWDELVDMLDQVAPACIRDPEGYREFVSLGDLDYSDSLEMVRGLSWSFERVHFAEPTTQAFE
ncbi:MAG TPA: fibronectin type III domain-containing protein [Phytomonospora sp.]